MKSELDIVKIGYENLKNGTKQKLDNVKMIVAKELGMSKGRVTLACSKDIVKAIYIRLSKRYTQWKWVWSVLIFWNRATVKSFYNTEKKHIKIGQSEKIGHCIKFVNEEIGHIKNWDTKLDVRTGELKNSTMITLDTVFIKITDFPNFPIIPDLQRHRFLE